MRPTECLHSLAKTRSRPAFSSGAKEQSGDDSPKEREWDRLWNHWFQREERRDLSCFPQIAQAIRRQASHRDRLGTRSRIEQREPLVVKSKRVVLWRPCEPARTIARFYPGGQASARLPRRCTCKCGTLSPASGPQLMTTR
jgi:hypothetical protein